MLFGCRIPRVAVALAQDECALFVAEPAHLFRLTEPDHPGEQPGKADGGADQKRRAPAERADQTRQNKTADGRAEIRAAVENGRKQGTLFQRNPFADDAAGCRYVVDSPTPMSTRV